MNDSRHLTRLKSKPDFSISFLSICLILLIIAIMITLPMRRHSVITSDYEFQAAENEFEYENMINVIALYDGRVIVHHRLVEGDISQIEGMLKEYFGELHEQPSKVGFIADTRLPYEKVVTIMKYIQRAGVETVFIHKNDRISYWGLLIEHLTVEFYKKILKEKQ
jgi:biopolymer transport protein ExbD